jgi:hypothetical protein
MYRLSPGRGVNFYSYRQSSYKVTHRQYSIVLQHMQHYVPDSITTADATRPGATTPHQTAYRITEHDTGNVQSYPNSRAWREDLSPEARAAYDEGMRIREKENNRRFADRQRQLESIWFETSQSQQWKDRKTKAREKRGKKHKNLPVVWEED